MDCGFHPVDSGFQVLNNGLLTCEIPVFSWIPKRRIPDQQAKIPWSPESYLPFTWEDRKFRLENQMVHAIPYVKRQILWAAILGDAIFPLCHVCSVDLDKFCIETVVLLPLQMLFFLCLFTRFFTRVVCAMVSTPYMVPGMVQTVGAMQYV